MSSLCSLQGKRSNFSETFVTTQTRIKHKMKLSLKWIPLFLAILLYLCLVTTVILFFLTAPSEVKNHLPPLSGAYDIQSMNEVVLTLIINRISIIRSWKIHLLSSIDNWFIIHVAIVTSVSLFKFKKD
jgi:uncharacterized membrane protein YadS